MRLNETARIAVTTVGGLLGVGGLLMMMIGIGHLADPSSMADDSDPFAPTVRFDDTLWLIGLSFCAFVIGTWICVRMGRDG